MPNEADEWDDPRFVLEEISRVLTYFSTKVPERVRKYGDYDQVLKNLQEIRAILGKCLKHKFPFINVVLDELNRYSRVHIENIKRGSIGCTKFKPSFDIERHIYLLNDSLNISVYVKCKYRQISGGSKIFDKIPVALRRFLTIGENLKADPMALKIIKELKSLKNRKVKGEKSDPTPGVSYYASIIGPSYMGKTQTAFTLCHNINVIYVNLLSTIDGDVAPVQLIYSPFSQFSTLFLQTIKLDFIELLKADSQDAVGDLDSFSSGFYTLGLLYIIIHDHVLKPDQSVEERFFEIINIRSALIPAITVLDFKEQIKELGINLDAQLLFIDELPTQNDDGKQLIPKIRFLRNLCRAAQLPSLLCGTNSHVNNLIGKSDHRLSGKDNVVKKWVKVLTKLPKASLESICCVMNFKSAGNEKLTMFDFIDHQTKTFKYDEFKLAVFGPAFASVPHLDSAMKLLGFVLDNVGTALPGVAYLSVKYILKALIKARNGGEFQLESLWKKLNKHLINEINSRKDENLGSRSALTASVHILTYPGTVKDANERGNVAARKVNEHFFYFGNHEDTSFDLFLKGINKSNTRRRNSRALIKKRKYKLFKGDHEFQQECHFSPIREDFLLCYSLWNMWYALFNPDCRPTLATIFEKYLKKGFKFARDTVQPIADFISLEILALWSIAYASHADILGNTSGTTILEEFLKNVQYFDVGEDDRAKKYFEALQVPESLETFLKKITVPYLIVGPPPLLPPRPPKITDSKKAGTSKKVQKPVSVPREATRKIPIDDSQNQRKNNSKLIQDLSQFMKLGTCSHPADIVGWDTLFDLECNGIKETGYIECKLWKSPVGLNSIYKYYNKACESKSKVSFLVAKKIQVSLKKTALFSPEDQRLIEAEVTAAIADEEAAKIAKTAKIAEKKKSIQDQNENAEKITELWKNAANHINIYAITFKIDRENRREVGKFTVTAIKEHAAPTGVFILIESNFSPPELSSRS